MPPLALALGCYLDAVVAWLHSYVAADHETEVARYVEHDQQTYVALIRNLERFFSGDVSTGLGASLPTPDDNDRELFASAAWPRRLRQARGLAAIGAVFAGILMGVAMIATGYQISRC